MKHLFIANSTLLINEDIPPPLPSDTVEASDKTILSPYIFNLAIIYLSQLINQAIDNDFLEGVLGSKLNGGLTHCLPMTLCSSVPTVLSAFIVFAF